MKLIDAIRAAEKDPETPQPIHAGRCETTMSGGYPCTADGRWWFYHKVRCDTHKVSER